jgi:hypothetical protein
MAYNIDDVSTIGRLEFIEDDSVELVYRLHPPDHCGSECVEENSTEWVRVCDREGCLNRQYEISDDVKNDIAKQRIVEDNRLLPGRGGNTNNIQYKLFDFATSAGIARKSDRCAGKLA